MENTLKPQQLILLVLVAAMTALLLGWWKSSATSSAPTSSANPPAATRPTASAPAGSSVSAGVPGSPAEETRWRIRPGRQAGCTLGSLTATGSATRPPYRLQVTLRSEGAAVESVRLADHFQTVADKRLFEKVGRNETRFAEEAAKHPEKYRGHYCVLSPVVYKDMSYYALATRKVILSLGEPSPPNPPKDWTFEEIGTKRWQLVSVRETDDSQSAVFEWPIYRADNLQTPLVVLRKTYTLRRGRYSLDVAMECVNHSDQPIRLELDQAGPIGVGQEDPRMDDRTAVVARLQDGVLQRQEFSGSELPKKNYGEAISLGRSDAASEPVLWMGLVNKFFGSVLYLQPDEPEGLNASAVAAQFYLRPVQQTDQQRMWETGLWIHEIALAPAGSPAASRTLRCDLFAGPKLRQLFRNDPLYARLNYQETINNGGGCGLCTFDWLMEGLMWLLIFFARFLFGNFGLAIFLLVLIVRLLLHPLTKYGQVSMARMQKSLAALRPQMDRIREKYADDRAAQQRELLKLQKEAGVGPGQMLGCLPMVLQMPIWIALYTGLNTEVALRHAAFLPVWITDLAAPDQLFRFGRNLPLVGGSFNLLPILLTVAMYLSMKMTPSAEMQAATPEQKQQQVMMKILMPLMMLFFFYNAPSGLTLYIMASTFAGVAESYYIRKHIQEREKAQAASEIVIETPGGSPRAARPKKPRGPFWIKRG